MKKQKNHTFWIQSIFVVGFIVGLFFLPFIFRTSNEPSQAASKPKIGKGDCEIVIEVIGNDIPIKLEDYVIGVVAAEMPANFHPEALKAQAIAARTYVLKSTNYGEIKIQPTVERQVFYDTDTRKKNWDTSYEENEKKIREAVESTAGEIILYNNELITAMFHSMSNGMTESAKNYSGNDLPYLQPVASTDFQYAKNYETTKTFTINEWNNLLNTKLTLSQVKKIRLQKNDTGRVEKVTMEGQEWSGRDIRAKLDLRSTDFTIEVVGEKINVTTEGYGHGVGMSQYGADAMAKGGATAHEIINHYYTDTKIEKISCKK